MADLFVTTAAFMQQLSNKMDDYQNLCAVLWTTVSHSWLRWYARMCDQFLHVNVGLGLPIFGNSSLTWTSLLA